MSILSWCPHENLSSRRLCKQTHRLIYSGRLIVSPRCDRRFSVTGMRHLVGWLYLKGLNLLVPFTQCLHYVSTVGLWPSNYHYCLPRNNADIDTYSHTRFGTVPMRSILPMWTRLVGPDLMSGAKRTFAIIEFRTRCNFKLWLHNAGECGITIIGQPPRHTQLDWGRGVKKSILLPWNIFFSRVNARCDL